jgi:hypothetical protein
MTSHVVRALVGAIAAGLLFTACDPGFVAEGVVTDPAGTPIKNAEVRLRCDETGPGELLAHTGRDGRFRGHEIGWRPESCRISVTAEGMRPLLVPMMEHCTKKRGARACLEVKVDAVLTIESDGRRTPQ